MAAQLDPVFLLQNKVFDFTFRGAVLSILDRNHIFIDCEYGAVALLLLRSRERTSPVTVIL